MISWPWLAGLRIPLRVGWIYMPFVNLVSADKQWRQRQGATIWPLKYYKIEPSFSCKFVSLSSRCFTDRQEHSNDVRAYLWRRLIYRDANRTALCFQNVLGSYSNLPWAQSLPLRERDKGRTTKSKQRTERTWSGKKEQCRRRKTKKAGASTSPSATWWTTLSRSKYKINWFFLWLTSNKMFKCSNV